MSFESNVIIGAAPLFVQFTDTTTGLVVSWYWEFGDGETSTDKSPIHIYYTEGKYDVSLTVTYSDTTTEKFTIEDYIMVDAVKLEAIPVCLRYATEESEGYGWSEFDCDNSVVPMDNFGAIQLIDDNGTSRDIVFDKEDFCIYETDTCDRFIEVKASALDRGTYEIPWEKWERESIFDASNEHKEISHEASHIYIRPTDDKYRGASGYTSSGQRAQQELSLEAYLNGEKTTPAGIVSKIVEEGEASFCGVMVKDNRVQLVVKGTAAEIKVTGHSHSFLGIIGKPSPALRIPNEYLIQKELITNKVIHLSRGNNSLLNRVTGKTLDGSATKIEGPDGKISGFHSDANIICDNFAYTSNCTIILWSKDSNLFTGISDWKTYGALDSDWILYYKKIVEGIPANLEIIAGDKFDVRVYNKLVSDDAIESLYNDVIYFEGKKLLPGF